MKTILDHIKEAHNLSGAPGRVTGYFARGYYTVKLQFGVNMFRFLTHGAGDPRVTVMPSWTIAGDRQRKQATSTHQPELEMQ